MSAWAELRPRMLPAVVTMFLLLQVLFLVNMCYLYATQLRSNNRYHNFNILYVDYDQGVIGRSIWDAYQRLQGDGFPTLLPASLTFYEDESSIRDAVCRGEYWAAVYSNRFASKGLASALANGSGVPTSLTFVWNGVRYPVFSQAAIYANFLRLIEGTRSLYYSNNGSAVVGFANLSDPTTLQAFLDPIHSQEINIKKTEHGTRVFYNTVSMAMPIIQQFFFVLALNGISSHFGAFSKIPWRTNGIIRLIASLLYTLIGGLLMTSYLRAYKEDWSLNGSEFVLTWMILWFLMHINFLFFDVATAVIPIQFMPFVVLTWVILNIASTISPFEINPGVFRWGYALPSHEAYQILIQIWSGGCNNLLYQALPVMFAWWIAMVPAAVYGMHYRCKAAIKETDHINQNPNTDIQRLEHKAGKGAQEPATAE